MRSELAGRYTYEAIGSNWSADAAIRQGYVQIDRDGYFVAVNLPQDWQSGDESPVFRGRFVPKDIVENRWPLSVFHGHELEIVGKEGEHGPTFITFGRETKTLSFNQALEGDWIMYKAPR